MVHGSDGGAPRMVIVTGWPGAAGVGVLWGGQGCIGRGGASAAVPEAVGQAVGGGCQSGWGRLLSVTNAVEAGAWGGQWLGIGWGPWRGGGVPPPLPMHPFGGGGCRCQRIAARHVSPSRTPSSGRRPRQIRHADPPSAAASAVGRPPGRGRPLRGHPGALRAALGGAGGGAAAGAGPHRRRGAGLPPGHRQAALPVLRGPVHRDVQDGAGEGVALRTRREC